MHSYRNNHKRNRFRSNGDRNFKKRNGESYKFKSDYSSNISFQRKFPGRNNHNASKLVEKYNDLAREALSKGDKILSENYFQHADHFARIIQQKNLKSNESKIQQSVVSNVAQTNEVEELDNKDKELTKEKK